MAEPSVDELAAEARASWERTGQVLGLERDEVYGADGANLAVEVFGEWVATPLGWSVGDASAADVARAWLGGVRTFECTPEGIARQEQAARLLDALRADGIPELDEAARATHRVLRLDGPEVPELPPSLFQSAALDTTNGLRTDELLPAVTALLERGLDVTVEVGVTQLGEGRMKELLHDDLSFHELSFPAGSLDAGFQWEQLLALMEAAAPLAAERDRRVGLLLSRPPTIDHADRGPVPMDDELLHVLALNLLMRVRWNFSNRHDLLFSAGPTARTFPDLVAIGMAPVLAGPRAFDTAPPREWLRTLERRMKEHAVPDVDDLRIVAYDLGWDGLDMRLEENTTRRASELALEAGEGMRAAAGPDNWPSWLAETLYLNTEEYAFIATRELRAKQNQGRR